MGLSFRDSLPAFEEAGRSLLGQVAMRVDAPDEGNMHLLELVGRLTERNLSRAAGRGRHQVRLLDDRADAGCGIGSEDDSDDG